MDRMADTVLKDMGEKDRAEEQILLQRIMESENI